MCLGIPGQNLAITDPDRMMALAEVSGVRRQVNVACVASGSLAGLIGQRTLIHAGGEFIHGLGCPVCVLPMARVDEAVALA